jgi:hypothetical protein
MAQGIGSFAYVYLSGRRRVAIGYVRGNGNGDA